MREDDEWQAGRIDGARHLPMGEVEARRSELDPSRPIVAVCRSGERSAEMAELLRSRGFDVENMEGGMQAWQQAGLPIDTPDGRAGEVA